MNRVQCQTFEEWLDAFEADIEEFHHGDCKGVDVQAAKIVQDRIGIDKIICHPPISNRHRAHFGGGTILKPRRYLTRDHDIVDAVGLLIAVTWEYTEQLRSGTWATVRYAHRMCTPVLRIDPQGRLIE
jgi:hypothetical protein